MIVQLFTLLFIAFALFVIAAKSVAIAKEGERVVVLRFGTFHRVYRPGLSLLIPFIDKGVKVRVDQIPGGQNLTERELEQKLAQAWLQNPER